MIKESMIFAVLLILFSNVVIAQDVTENVTGNPVFERFTRIEKKLDDLSTNFGESKAKIDDVGNVISKQLSGEFSKIVIAVISTILLLEVVRILFRRMHHYRHQKEIFKKQKEKERRYLEQIQREKELKQTVKELQQEVGILNDLIQLRVKPLIAETEKEITMQDVPQAKSPSLFGKLWRYKSVYAFVFVLLLLRLALPMLNFSPDMTYEILGGCAVLFALITFVKTIIHNRRGRPKPRKEKKETQPEKKELDAQPKEKEIDNHQNVVPNSLASPVQKEPDVQPETKEEDVHLQHDGQNIWIKKTKHGRYIVMLETGKKGFGAWRILGNKATLEEAKAIATKPKTEETHG